MRPFERFPHPHGPPPGEFEDNINNAEMPPTHGLSMHPHVPPGRYPPPPMGGSNHHPIMGQHPPLGGPPPPGGPHPPPFGFHFWGPPPGHRHGPPPPGAPPPFPFKKKAFKHFQDMFLLILIADSKDGITAYQLEKQYNYPRTSAIRTLDKMEEKGLIESNLEVEDGREQKKYQITELGLKEAEQLKGKWASRIAMWGEMVPPEKHGHPLDSGMLRDQLKGQIERAEDKDQAVDILRGVRGNITIVLNRHKERMKLIEESLQKITEIIDMVESSADYSKDKILEQLKDLS